MYIILNLKLFNINIYYYYRLIDIPSRLIDMSLSTASVYSVCCKILFVFNSIGTYIEYSISIIIIIIYILNIHIPRGDIHIFIL